MCTIMIAFVYSIFGIPMLLLNICYIKDVYIVLTFNYLMIVHVGKCGPGSGEGQFLKIMV